MMMMMMMMTGAHNAHKPLLGNTRQARWNGTIN